jgi:hypothetical protein
MGGERGDMAREVEGGWATSMEMERGCHTHGVKGGGGRYREGGRGW